MHPEVQNDICYTLVLELLAYQFASPVKWIETQDVLLRKEGIQRVIEIGPADTLASMAKKTLAARDTGVDPAISKGPDILFHQRDAQKIRYESNARNPPPTAKDEQRPVAKKVAVPSPPRPIPAPEPANTSGAGNTLLEPAAPIPDVADVPVAPGDIIVTIVASKLKKRYQDVDVSSSIKKLTGGRSTLENEIVGDIGAEFASAPDRCEEIPLKELGCKLQGSGQLGQVAQGLLRHLFSLQMPSGFNQQSARAYLESRWHLPTGRQTVVLLRACCNQQTSRLSSKSDAEASLDDLVREYAADVDLNLDRPTQVQVAAPVSAITQPVRQMVAEPTRKQALLVPDKAYKKAKEECDQLRRELDALTEELGDTFVRGVKPSFAGGKVRRFSSSWNWALQDLLEVFYSVLRGKATPEDQETRKKCILIAKRSDPRLLRVIQHLQSRTWPCWNPNVESAKATLAQLLAICDQISSTGLSAFPLPTDEPNASIKDDEPSALEAAKSGSPHRLKRRSPAQTWHDDEQLDALFGTLVNDGRRSGFSFEERVVLVTGAGEQSIGRELLKGLLASGARVIVTTSSYSRTALKAYQEIFMQYGIRHAELIVVPFNQGSQKDIEALTSYIYASEADKGLGWDVDNIVPLAAISETGRELDAIDSKSELAHRIELVNLLRLLGAVKRRKEARRTLSRPAQVLLPLSPNHGSFGGDGLYAESKLALETLFDKWYSESWAPYLSVCGASIGWTRGTGLMAGNDAFVQGVQRLGVRTFTQAEMAFRLLALMSPALAAECDRQPVMADMSGGLGSFPGLKDLLRGVRADLGAQKALKRAVDRLADTADDDDGAAQTHDQALRPQPDVKLSFPTLPDWQRDVEPLHAQLSGMVDLDTVVVVTGFAELGPWGNARTRWDMEAHGVLSVQGCIEMAWIMSLIKSRGGDEDDGWVDAKTGEPVHAADVKARYERQILDHCGIRLVPADDGSKGASLLQEITVEEDLPPFAAPRDMAEQFQREQGDAVDVFDTDGDEVLVQLKRGASMLLPKARGAARRIAGALPDGWDPRVYGISEDIAAQVDPVTLHALVTTAEALLASGITDPYELYKHVHVSQVGNCLGSGLGGVASLKKMFLTRHLDRPVQSDVLAESFINTTAAWVNMLLLSAAGPIRTAVGACATAIESLETGVETIASGRAKMCLVGGFDDLDAAVSAEFAHMKATADGGAEAARGRAPAEASRPTSASRAGFVEAQGAGVQVLTSARLALDMGLPIAGIVALAATASDTAGRSVPAPGCGLLALAAETPARFPPPMLGLGHRRRRLELRRQTIRTAAAMEAGVIEHQLAALDGADAHGARAALLEQRAYALREADRLCQAATHAFGNGFWQAAGGVAPIRGALAVWGLTVDDVGVATLHGTSTRLNDLNEAQVLQRQLAHLGRAPGNPLPAVCQKHLTGHAKGAAGAWMLNGALQVLDSGLVPGNRNADDVDARLRAAAPLLVFPHRSIQTPAGGVKAFSLTSFGFGQKGAQAIGVHPRYLFAALDGGRAEYDAYCRRVAERRRRATARFQAALATNTLFVAKDAAPYAKEKMADVFLNPEARASSNEDDEIYYEDDLVDKLM